MLVKIEKIVNGGYGLGTFEDGKKVFVEGAYPDEVVKVEIVKEKRDFSFAKPVYFVEKSPFRRTPLCPNFNQCGGCHFMDISYEKQLDFKREIVKDLFERIVGFSDVEKTVASPLGLNYRTKVELTAAFIKGEPKLGFKVRKSHFLVSIKECLIAPERANMILEKLPKILSAAEVPIYNFRKRKGILKHVVVRHAFSTNQTMVIFVTKTENFPQAKILSKLLVKEFPWVYSIIHVMNSKDSVILRGPYRTLHGEGIIVEEFDWETYQIPPTAFFQSNYYVAKKLADFVFKVSEVSGKERVLDLYSGVGLFSLRLSSAAKKVVGVESNRVSYKAAVSNSHINERKNTSFVNSDVLEFLKNNEENFDIVVVDPPRSGMEKEAIAELLGAKPKKIIYISCEPSTLARDVKALVDGGYKLERVVPFDMFPQTFHVETVALLQMKSS
ncbi:MAG: 23S rRNA (uracil(1939)-C(5))-methyltransferase RlmD [Thermotogaceae bacterium]|nr:23S rRNA (uracil(1939)-C(5))-methyltransferase RlmD [Thermotogaceae bacterium]